MDIVALQRLIDEFEGKVAEYAANGDTDKAFEASGRLAAYRDQLNAEIARVNDENASLRESAANLSTGENQHRSLAEQVLGDVNDFAGIEPGFHARGSVDNAATALPMPVSTDRTLPAPVSQPTGFLSTIPHGTSEGSEQFFKQPVLTNSAAGWVSGIKPESAIQWAQATANPETIAHWIPVQKQMVRRYTMLESMINGALLLGLEIVKDRMALRGSNTSGIVGVTNTAGILTHTKNSAKNLKDTFSAMSRKVRIATGYPATHVCLSPYAIEELSEVKDTTGRYLFPDIKDGGTIAGLTVVEDVNMTVVTTSTTGSGDSAVTTTVSTETALVYYNNAARWNELDGAGVEIGLQGTQFVENAYTMLGETTALLRVDVPAGFCYCSDLGITQEA